jgi:hypothetical protein
MVIGKGPKELGCPGPRDPLEDLKALFVRKLEKWWREIKQKEAIPPAMDAAVVAKTVPPKLQPARGTWRSTVRSSGDETVGFVPVARGGRGGTKRKGRRPEMQHFPTVRASTEDARAAGRTSSSLPSSSLPSSSLPSSSLPSSSLPSSSLPSSSLPSSSLPSSSLPGISASGTVDYNKNHKGQGRGVSPRWPLGHRRPSARGKNLRREPELRTPTE